MDDVGAVMDAAGSERAAIMGANEGSLMAAHVRCDASGAHDRAGVAQRDRSDGIGPENEFGLRADVPRAPRLIGTTWGTTSSMATLNPSLADNAEDA